MKRRLLSALLAGAIMCSAVPTAFAASSEATSAADSLHSLGLFNGTGVDASGQPIYNLDRTPTRAEAVAMLVRLLGKDDEAKNGSWNMPFTDVATWAKPYVGYAYANKLTSGKSSTVFGGSDTVTASQYITFVLRALGYESGTDFAWNKAWELSDQIGVTDGQYSADTSNFTRGDVAVISANALKKPRKGRKSALIYVLVNNGVVDASAAERYLAGIKDSSSLTWVDVFNNRHWIRYIKMNSGYYTPDTTIHEISCVDGEIYIPVQFGEEAIYGWQLFALGTDLLSLLSGKYTVEKTENPYLAGKLYLFANEMDPYHIKTQTKYLNATDSYTTWQFTIKGKTISSPSEPTKNEFTIDGVRCVGIPASGGGEVMNYWINANDLCKVCGVQERYSYLEKDTDMGLSGVLIFE